MIAKKVSLIAAATAMAFAGAVSAKSAPAASRVASPVTNANHQADDDDDDSSTAVILGVILVVLIGVAATSGSGEPQSP
jgi:hypothetical protein